MFAAALPAIGSAASAFASYLGQQDTNETNREIAEQANAFSAQQAAMNRDWQERMSNTSWQRGIEDMKKAGVNPMLAFSKGGASTPGGAQASGQTGAPMQSSFVAGVSSAIQAASAFSQVLQAQANIGLTNAQTRSVLSQIPGKAAESQFSADKYGAFHDAVALVKHFIGYDKNLASANQVAEKFRFPSSFNDIPDSISSAFGASQRYLRSLR